jgi:hypothetical protein
MAESLPPLGDSRATVWLASVVLARFIDNRMRNGGTVRFFRKPHPYLLLSFAYHKHSEGTLSCTT